MGERCPVIPSFLFLAYISTVINLRTRGMSMSKLPLTSWAFFLTAVLGVLRGSTAATFQPLIRNVKQAYRSVGL